MADIHPVHHSLKRPGVRHKPHNMASMRVEPEQAATLARHALEIFTDCVNAGVGFQDALAAIYLSGVMMTLEMQREAAVPSQIIPDPRIESLQSSQSTPQGDGQVPSQIMPKPPHPIPPSPPQEMGGETQATIWEWCERTFGPSTSHSRMVNRTAEELGELSEAVELGSPKAAEEIADVMICLYRLAGDMQVDIHAEINRKMAINRKREWKPQGDGTAYHVKAAPALPEPGKEAQR